MAWRARPVPPPTVPADTVPADTGPGGGRSRTVFRAARARTPARELAALTPRQQLTAGRTGRRLVQLFAGLTLYGWSMAMMVRSELGLDPWDVFHDGVSRWMGLSFGTVVIVVGLFVLALWIPLRQWPGLGTLANAVVIGLVTDLGLALLSTPESMPARIGLLTGGIVLNGLAGGMYIGSQFGAGPRDGLMTGLVRRTGRSIRLVRTSLELTVLALGWLLGGVVGVGTVLYALAIGPLVQIFLPRLVVELPAERVPPTVAAAASSGSAADATNEIGTRAS